MADAAALAGRTIVVTGAAGFVGSALVRELGRVPCVLQCWSRQPRVAPVVERATVEMVVADVREPDAWRRAADADVVFHLAGQTSAMAAERDPKADADANVAPIHHLERVVRASGRRPVVVFASTATVVGVTTEVPVDESRPEQPATWYDRHKLEAERHLNRVTAEGVCRATTLRLANVYGPGPAGSAPDRGFLNAMVARAVRGEDLAIWGAGAWTRDYVFVDDVARAFVAVAAGGAAIDGGACLVGSGRGTTIAEAMRLIAEGVRRRTGRTVTIRSIAEPDGVLSIEHRHFVADTRRLREATGWSPQVSLEEGIDRTMSAVWAAGGRA